MSLLGLVTAVPAAYGQEASGTRPPVASHGTPPVPINDVASLSPHWARGPERAFISSTFDVGALFFRPQMAFGYGKPHRSWLGVEVQSNVGATGGYMYGGVRIDVPHLDVSGGVRYQVPLDRDYLPRRERYRSSDLDLDVREDARYLAAEANLVTAANVLGGRLVLAALGMHVRNVPDDANLFEERLRAIIASPWALRLRLDYLYPVAPTFAVGGRTEAVVLFERDDAVVRAGPAVAVLITDHLTARGAVSIVAHSPDAIGIRGWDYGELSFRYRWATGDPEPGFP